jgi:hypothetical protein
MELSQAWHAARAGAAALTYTLVVEMQVVIGLTATAFCAVGMLVNKDFQVRLHFQTFRAIQFFAASLINISDAKPEYNFFIFCG